MSVTFFRILAFKSEIQNGSDVLKPVLCTRSVMKLSVVMSNAHEDERQPPHEGRQAEDLTLDDLFVCVVRQSILPAAVDSNTQVRVSSVIGRRRSVAMLLKQQTAVENEIDQYLSGACEGIHAMTTVPTDSDNLPELWLFNWTSEEFFAPKKLRDTATYVLRFLTCLAPTVHCVLEGNDVRDLKAHVANMQTQQQSISSYAVDFRVEKHEQVEDGLTCGELVQEPLPTHDRMASWRLVGGRVAAIAAMTMESRFKVRVSHTRTFVSGTEFSSFVALKATTRKVELMPIEPMETNIALLEILLTAFENWTTLSVARLNEALATNIAVAKEQMYQEFHAQNQEWWSKIVELASLSFTVEGLQRPWYQDGNQELEAELQRRDEFSLACGLLRRLRYSVSELCVIASNHPSGLRDAVENVIVGHPLRNTFTRFVSSVVTGVQNWLPGFSPYLPNDDIESRLNTELGRAREQWLQLVEKGINQIIAAAVDEHVRELSRQSLEHKISLLLQAFASLQQRLAQNPNAELMCTIRFNSGTEYRVTIDDEDWQDIDTPLTMFKLWSIGDSSQPIGVYFPANQCYMSAFTAEKSSGIIIFSNEKTTRIEKWEPLLHSEHNLSFVAEYPSRSVLASFVAKTRSLALLNPDESKIVVLKFNARFSVSHTVVQLDWRKKTSLNGPPTSIVLTDNALAMVDTSGIIQIYDFISRQTCRRVGIAGPADRYHLFTGLGDQMVGCICFDKSSAARVVATAFDDNRSIPTTSPSNMVSSLEIDVTSVADKLFFLNTSSRTLHSCQFNVSVQSHKMRVSSKLNEQSKQDQKADHLLWTWFHMFEKFPVRGLLDEAPVCVSTDHPIKIYVVGSSEDAEDVRCVFRFIQTQLVALNKPLYGRNLEKDIQVLCAPSSQELPAMQTNLVLLGPFLRSLVTLVPLQVCRAENNSLTVLRNGEYHASATSHDRILQATDIARSMRFGMISLLLEAWTGQCCVISSMGKQSTGKSYFLNHLTVSSFAISGGRCTDGLWIGTRFVNSSTMLAVLDFEGLGSFERSEQEDVFLSVLNAAVSSVTIFRLDMRLDKEVDELFRRFQNGMQLIKGGSNLFQGILIMSIKDVNPLDEESVLQEFKAKLGRLVELNDEQNFVSDMYNGSVRMNTSPPFRTAGYFDSLAQTEALVRNTFTATRFTGKSFLDCLRLVLAKIIALDWTSMEHSARVMKTNDLYELLPAVLRTGRLISRELALRNTIVSTAWNDLYDIDGKWTKLTEVIDLDDIVDSTVDFGVEYMKTVTEGSQELLPVIARLHSKFCDLSSNRSVIRRQVQADFDAFLSFLVLRRVERASIWALDKLDGEIRAWEELEQHFCERFRVMLRRCTSECTKCQQGCLRSILHPPLIHHDCGTDHLCNGKCSYCEATDGSSEGCNRPAGHEGHCECSSAFHTCRAKCELRGARNCGGGCEKEMGHDGPHRCSTARHWCGHACSANKCPNLCCESVESPHLLHKCQNGRCVEHCEAKSCRGICKQLDHFHGQTTTSSTVTATNHENSCTHLCGREHRCMARCEEQGICHIEVNHRAQTRTFRGARGSFEYALQKINGKRKRCAKKINPTSVTHSGPHNCGEDLHFCDSRCEYCLYFCSKPYGHPGMHNGAHGNMREMVLVAEEDDIDLEDRKYKAGESGIAEMCNMLCNKLGRGHSHLVECEQGSSENCVYSGVTDHRQHCLRQLKPPSSRAYDEVLHREFWRNMGWEDPCQSAADRELFGKCPLRCTQAGHDDNPSWCVLDAWHHPVRPHGEPDGHQFECVHWAPS